MSTEPPTTDIETRHQQFEQQVGDVSGGIGLFADYVLLQRLGCGTVGLVYKARNRQNPARLLALKVFYPDQETPTSRERFKRESSAVAVQFDENIMPILDFGEENDIPFFTMPFVQGQTLESLISRDETPIPRVVEIGMEVAQGLSTAHSTLNIIHRDLKPSNIWISTRGHVRILDFGLAFPLDPAATRLTVDGALVGTPDYCSPEQVEARGNYDGRSDLFSLGTLLYRLAVGRLPFNSPNVLVDILQAHAPPAHDANNRVPIPLSKVITRLMAKAPAHRYQKAEDVVMVLRRILDRMRQDSAPVHDIQFPTNPRAFAATVLEVDEFRVRSAFGNVIALTGTKLATQQLRSALDAVLYFLDVLQQEIDRQPPFQPDQVVHRVRRINDEHTNRTAHVRVPQDLSDPYEQVGKILPRFVSDVIAWQNKEENSNPELAAMIASVRRELEPYRSHLEQVFNSVADSLREISSD